MIQFGADFSTLGVPETGLSPTITIRDTFDGSVVINAAAMTEVGGGAYKYDFTNDTAKKYSIVIDGGVDTLDSRYMTAWSERAKAEAETALIMADTNELQTDDIPGTLATIAGYIDTEIVALQTDLDNGTDGLGALKALIDAVPTAVEIQAEIEANGASVIDTIRDYIENVTYGLSALKTLIDAVNTDLSNGTDGLGALKTLIDTNKSELDGLQGADGKCLISTDVQNLIASLIVDAEDSVCDALLTGTSHNIATSLGRRVREIGAFAIESGTAQAGTSTSITLAATANGADGIFNRNLIVLTDNTGKGQTRTIVDYNSTSKVCVIDREWRITPDNTTAYQVVPNDTPLVVDHGIAQAGSTATTIKLRAYASSVNNNYLCNIVTIIAGTGRGQARLIGAYNGTTKVATICGDNWVTIPDTTSVYVMLPYGTTCTACFTDSALALINTEIDNALNTAIPGSPTAGSINEKIKALPSGIAKNVALPNLDIYMLLEDGITAATGKTVTGQIRKDAGSFIALTNAITEVSGGLYTIADGIMQAEMNADKVTLKFTASDCRDTIMIIYPT